MSEVVRRWINTINKKTSNATAVENRPTKALCGGEVQLDNFSVNTEDNIYKKHIREAAEPLLECSNEENVIKALRKVGYLSWTGGPAAAKYAGELLSPLTEALYRANEASNVKVEIVKAMSGICYQCKQNQDMARSCGLVSLLIDILCDGKITNGKDLKPWVCYALLVLTMENYGNQCLALKAMELRDVLEAFSKKCWKGWERNEALELYNFLGYSHRSQSGSNLTLDSRSTMSNSKGGLSENDMSLTEIRS